MDSTRFQVSGQIVDIVNSRIFKGTIEVDNGKIINIIEEDIPYVSTHKQEIVDRYTEIFTDLMSR